MRGDRHWKVSVTTASVNELWEVILIKFGTGMARSPDL